MKTNTTSLRQGRDDLVDRLVAAGWPKRIGLNNRRTTSANRVTLDGSTVRIFWTKGQPFHVYDTALRLVTTGKTRDDALIAMVKAREVATGRDVSRAGKAAEKAQPRDFGPTGEGQNAKPAPGSGQQALFAAE